MSLLDKYTLEELLLALEIAEGAERAALAEGIAIARQRRKYEWEKLARDKQLPPPGDWLIWLILAGRGFGKTLTGAQWIRKRANAAALTRWAVVAPTFKTLRDVCFEGETGLLNVMPPSEFRDGDPERAYNSSTAQIVLANGSLIQGYAAEVPDRLRGPQHHGAWCDELGAWRRMRDAWDQLQFGLRLGDYPQTVITTTPRPVPLINELVKRETVHLTTGSTFENEANLAPSALAELLARYDGTRLGRQELYAELLEDVEGALWTLARIEETRVTKVEVPDLGRILVNVDPSGGDKDGNDEQGIVVTGKARIAGRDGVAVDHFYAMADYSCKESPDGWGRRAVQAYLDFSADAVIVERNFGGDMAIAVVKNAAKAMGVEVNVQSVVASRGKQVRAEPIAGLFEQGRAHIVGSMPELEDQLTTTVFPLPTGAKSPDRLDAMVWGMTELSGDNAPVFLGSV